MDRAEAAIVFLACTPDPTERAEELRLDLTRGASVSQVAKLAVQLALSPRIVLAGNLSVEPIPSTNRYRAIIKVGWSSGWSEAESPLAAIAENLSDVLRGAPPVQVAVSEGRLQWALLIASDPFCPSWVEQQVLMCPPTQQAFRVLALSAAHFSSLYFSGMVTYTRDSDGTFSLAQEGAPPRHGGRSLEECFANLTALRVLQSDRNEEVFR